MNKNGIKYTTNHFFIKVFDIPAGELLVDYTLETFRAINYKTVVAPLINFYDLSTKDSEAIQLTLEMYAIPKERPGIEDILDSWGLKVWDAFDQFYVTRGKHDGDIQTVYFLGEDIDLEDVLKIRSDFIC